MDDSFEARFDRMCKAVNATTDAELARVLKIKQMSVCSVKERKRIPLSWLEKVATTFCVSVDWLLYGERRLSAQQLSVSTTRLTEDEVAAIKSEIGLRCADSCGTCYHANGRHEKYGLEAWYCISNKCIEVFAHQVCAHGHTRMKRN